MGCVSSCKLLLHPLDQTRACRAPHPGAVLPTREHVARSGDIFGCYSGEGAEEEEMPSSS